MSELEAWKRLGDNLKKMTSGELQKDFEQAFNKMCGFTCEKCEDTPSAHQFTFSCEGVNFYIYAPTIEEAWGQACVLAGKRKLWRVR